MAWALKEGNKYAINQVDYKWRIVTSNTEDIGIKDSFLTSTKLPDWLQQLVYGQEEEKRAWALAWEDSNCHHDKLYNQLEGMYPCQRSQGSKSRVAPPKKKNNEAEKLKPLPGWRQETETKSTERKWLELEPTRPVCASTVNVDVVLTLKNCWAKWELNFICPAISI